ncbi:MAG: hypothetical protein KGN78_15145 [Actinomycetales bacterium]|nr:hypothetical protein [Actinomycetales bacterium]
MASVMLAGSRHISSLPAPASEKVRELMNQGTWFLVGDAPGVDCAFQALLATAQYKRVVVFTALDSARHNFGGWEVRCIDSGLKSKGAAMHTAKDRQMVRNAESGLVVWDGNSPGTLANVIDFVDEEKPCLVWSPADDLLWTMDSPQSLEKWTAAYPEPTAEARTRLSRWSKRESRKIATSPESMFPELGHSA